MSLLPSPRTHKIYTHSSVHEMKTSLSTQIGEGRRIACTTDWATEAALNECLRYPFTMQCENWEGREGGKTADVFIQPIKNSTQLTTSLSVCIQRYIPTDTCRHSHAMNEDPKFVPPGWLAGWAGGGKAAVCVRNHRHQPDTTYICRRTRQIQTANCKGQQQQYTGKRLCHQDGMDRCYLSMKREGKYGCTTHTHTHKAVSYHAVSTVPNHQSPLTKMGASGGRAEMCVRPEGPSVAHPCGCSVCVCVYICVWTPTGEGDTNIASHLIASRSLR